MIGYSKGKISNWKTDHQALKQRGSLTFWMDEAAIKIWHNDKLTGHRGRSNTYSDSTISTALMIKGVFKLLLRALEGSIKLMNVELKSPDYSSISKRPKTVEVDYRLHYQSPARYIVIDSTGLKVFGEGEWKVRKHGQDKRRIWRKVHLAVDADTHEIVSAQGSLDSVHDSKILPTFPNPLRRKIK